MSPFVSAVLAASYLLAILAYFWCQDTLRPARGRQLLDAGAVLIDVGTPKQFALDHLAGAVNIPAESLAARQQELGEHSHPVVLYARSSMRSAVAAQMLRGIGFHRVLSVGTLHRWRAERPDTSWRFSGGLGATPPDPFTHVPKAAAPAEVPMQSPGT